MFVLGTSSTNSSVAMGGLSAAGIGGATGAGLAASPNGINGQSGASNNQQNTSSSSAGAGAGAGGAGDPLSQAYTGIQQYAGLSSTLLGQGKGHFFFFFPRHVLSGVPRPSIQMLGGCAVFCAVLCSSSSSPS